MRISRQRMNYFCPLFFLYTALSVIIVCIVAIVPEKCSTIPLPARGGKLTTEQLWSSAGTDIHKLAPGHSLVISSLLYSLALGYQPMENLSYKRTELG